MKWVDINERKPTLEDRGKEFLVAIKMTVMYDYQVCEWFDPEDGETEPFFQYGHDWCGQQIVQKEITHWVDEVLEARYPDFTN